MPRGQSEIRLVCSAHEIRRHCGRPTRFRPTTDLYDSVLTDRRQGRCRAYVAPACLDGPALTAREPGAHLHLSLPNDPADSSVSTRARGCPTAARPPGPLARQHRSRSAPVTQQVAHPVQRRERADRRTVLIPSLSARTWACPNATGGAKGRAADHQCPSRETPLSRAAVAYWASDT